MKRSLCTVIIVTHDSEKVLDKAMDRLFTQTIPPLEIILVDTGSKNIDYLRPYLKKPFVKLLFSGKESGFCRGNNLGYLQVKETSPYILLLNPDAFLTPTFIEKAQNFMEDTQHHFSAAITGTILNWDLEKDRASTKIDTTGIFRTWWGKWYDRDQGNYTDKKPYSKIEEVPALCAAVLFCRKYALDNVLMERSRLFDDSFHMYKEDIELSLRLRKKGWKLLFVPELIAYHCRGWQPVRKQMPRWCRLLSAKNELTIHWRMRSPIGITYSLLKYIAVKGFNV
jgi:N-acetylglucosaminyl-diphospho-decaprenol L-rhamnosyltransferase